LDRKQSLLQNTALIRLCDQSALKMHMLQRKGSKRELLQHCYRSLFATEKDTKHLLSWALIHQ